METILDVAIVGAGPGGLAAARTCARFGASAVVIDEQTRPGGQIYRQAPPGLQNGADLFGRKYVDGMAKANDIASSATIDWRLGQAVWAVLPPLQTQDNHFRLSLTGPDGLSEVRAKRLIAATGCYDMPVPFPGWTLPGVMGAGAVQAMMKGQRVVPGQNIVLAGSHPLLLVIGEQMLAFGIRPAHIVFTQRLSRAGRLLLRPDIVAGFAGPLLQAARALARLLRAGVPVTFNSVVIRAEGGERLQSVRLAQIDSSTGLPARADVRTVPCDVVGIGFGFTASSELVQLAGAAMRWSRTGGGWIASHDDGMRTNVAGLYVAGEVAGIGGADTAAAEGELAALSALADAGFDVRPGELRSARARRRRNRSFAALLRELADPGESLISALRDEGTVICRCEEITKAEIDGLLRENSFLGTADAVKLLGRPGMGACQGRYCSGSLSSLVSAATGKTIEEVGAFRPRVPIKPVPLRQFLQTPPTA